MLEARVLGHVRDAQQIRWQTSGSELQSSDPADPEDSEDDTQSDSSEMGDFIEHSYEVYLYSLSQTLMSNALHKAWLKQYEL